MHGGRVIALLVHPRDKHGGVGRRGGDYHLLGPACQVGRGLFDGGEDACGLDDNFGFVLAPREISRVPPVSVCARERERKCVCECVCVSVSAREREKVGGVCV